MQILLTGSDGYIGTVMAQHLIQVGHQVTGLDTGFYRAGWLCHQSGIMPKTISGDLRRITPGDLEGLDAIVHLAELSNDPLGQLNPTVTDKINHLGSVHLARVAREAGVKRFVYASSCSVYGAGTGDWKTEESEPNPQTAYADCKVKVEAALREMADRRFCPTMLRNATAYGVSPRMRFDIVLNNLAGLAWTTREIRLISDGSPWRPLVHIRDIAQSVERVLAAEPDLVAGEVFNVGSTGENFQVREIAEIVSNVFPGCQFSVGKSDGDNRSYRVNFDKITNHLPGFVCEWTAQRGAEELLRVFERIQLTRDQFEGRGHTRLKQLQYLLATGQLDDELFWREGAAVAEPLGAETA